MLRLFRVVAFSTRRRSPRRALAFADPPAPPAPAKPKQVVIISFDSARDISQWKRSRALAQAHRRAFHLFSVLRLPAVAGDAQRIHGARQDRGQIQHRLCRLEAGSDRAARADRACRVGRPRHRQPWLRPFRRQGLEQGRLAEGIRLVRAHSRERLCDQRHCARAPGLARFRRHAVVGFRAPYLSTSKALYEALPAAGYQFDASGVSQGPARAADQQRHHALFTAADPGRPEFKAGDRHGLQSLCQAFRRLRAAEQGGRVRRPDL